MEIVVLFEVDIGNLEKLLALSEIGSVGAVGIVNVKSDVDLLVVFLLTLFLPASDESLEAFEGAVYSTYFFSTKIGDFASGEFRVDGTGDGALDDARDGALLGRLELCRWFRKILRTNAWSSSGLAAICCYFWLFLLPSNWWQPLITDQ